MKIFSTLLLGLCGLLIICDITLIGTGVSFINELDDFVGHPGGKGKGGRRRGGGRNLEHDGESESDDDDIEYIRSSGRGKGANMGFKALQKKCVALLVFFSFVILLIVCLGFYLARAKQPSKCVLVTYGLITFFLGFLPMVIEGGSILALSRIQPEQINEYCNMSPEALEDEKINKILRRVLITAHKFDLMTEDILDQTMCT